VPSAALDLSPVQLRFIADVSEGHKCVCEWRTTLTRRHFRIKGCEKKDSRVQNLWAHEIGFHVTRERHKTSISVLASISFGFALLTFFELRDIILLRHFFAVYAVEHWNAMKDD
jgi:hypothetical protein